MVVTLTDVSENIWGAAKKWGYPRQGALLHVNLEITGKPFCVETLLTLNGMTKRLNTCLLLVPVISVLHIQKSVCMLTAVNIDKIASCIS